MFRYDGLAPTIKITKHQLYGLLKPRVGKKLAKSAAFGRKGRNVTQQIRENLSYSNKLKDIRLMYLLFCRLSAKQTIILENNKQKYQIIKEKRP